MEVNVHAQSAAQRARQLQAVAANPASDIWVSASAGSGKTKVLIDRLLQLLFTDTPLNSIICLTYTKAAAAEMSERLHSLLAAWFTLSPAELAGRLQAHGLPVHITAAQVRHVYLRLLEHPTGLQIQTIHSFCQSLLSRFAIEAGVPIGFTVLEDGVDRLLLEDITEQWLLEALRDDAKAHIAEAFTSATHETRKITLIQGIIDNRPRWLACLAAYPDSATFTAGLRQLLHLSADVTSASIIADMVAPPDRALLISAAATLQSCDKKTDVELHRKLTAFFAVPAASQPDAFKDYLDAFLTKEWTPRKTLFTKDVPLSVDEAIALTQEQDRLADLCQQYRNVAVLEQSVLGYTVASQIFNHYTQAKHTRGMLDYADLIDHTLRLLHQAEAAAWVRYKLEHKIQHVLVDEAQDTSPAQWLLIKALTEDFYSGDTLDERTQSLFVVGDFKQSIFSFQGAEPVLFTASAAYYQRAADAAQRAFAHVDLDVSFRSSPTILNVVDATFNQDSCRASLEILPQKPLTHMAFHQQRPGCVQVLPQISVHRDVNYWQLPFHAHEHQSPYDVLAENIALQIKELLSGRHYLACRGRLLQPGDIMILLRKRTHLQQAITQALTRHNIPVAGTDRLALAQHLVIKDLLALGQFLLLPENDLNLAALLKSPLLGLTEDDLFQLCYQRPGALWQVLQHSDQHQDAVNWLKTLLKQVDYLSPSALYAAVLDQYGGRQRLLTAFGQDAVDVLTEFINALYRFEQQHIPMLQAFLHWFPDHAGSIKRNMDSQENLVRIMTVHGAKGLQAPVVMLPDAVGKSPPSDGIFWMDDASTFIWTSSLDIPAAFTDAKTIASQVRTAESHRLLYVAMTRAEEQLYVFGLEEKNGDDSWYALIRSAMRQLLHMADEQDDGGSLVYGQAAAMPALTQPPQDMAPLSVAVAPIWLHEPVRPEPVKPRQAVTTPSAAPVVPLTTVQLASLQRGKTLHSLLQKLPALSVSEQSLTMQNTLEPVDITMLTAFLQHPDLQWIFHPSRQSEVSLLADTGRYYTIGRLDCLVAYQGDLWILDYKSNVQAPASLAEAPESYVHQLQAYRDLLQSLYPDHRIRCGLVWLASASIMEIP